MRCEQCRKTRCLVSFCLPGGNRSIVLCERCFVPVKRRLRLAGVPVPNTRRFYGEAQAEPVPK